VVVSRRDDGPRPGGRRTISSRRDRGQRPAIRRPSEGRAEQIIEVAATMFRRNGYMRTSMADIAAAVGILPGSLYHYIASKDDLLFAVIDRGNRELIERVESQPLGEMPADEALRLMMRVHIQEIARNITFAVVSTTDKRELKPEQRVAVEAMQSRYQRLIIELVRRGQAEGAWCARLDPTLASLAVPGIGNSLMTWYQGEADVRWTVDSVGELYAGMVVRALSCDHEPPCPSTQRVG
jgi:AcrR family transcriptional regulator